MNGSIIAKRDLRKLCAALSYDFANGGQMLFSKSASLTLVPGNNPKDVENICRIMGKYNVALDKTKCAVSIGAVPSLYQFLPVIRMVAKNASQRTQYEAFGKAVYASVCARQR